MLHTVRQTAWPIAPPMNIISAMPRTGRRPIRSERMPAARPPNKAPSVVAEVINSFLKDVDDDKLNRNRPEEGY